MILFYWILHIYVYLFFSFFRSTFLLRANTFTNVTYRYSRIPLYTLFYILEATYHRYLIRLPVRSFLFIYFIIINCINYFFSCIFFLSSQPNFYFYIISIIFFSFYINDNNPVFFLIISQSFLYIHKNLYWINIYCIFYFYYSNY